MAPQPSRWTVGAIWTILVLSIILDYAVPLGDSGRIINLSAFDIAVPLCLVAIWASAGLARPALPILSALAAAVLLVLCHSAVSLWLNPAVEPVGLVRETVKVVAFCALLAMLLALFTVPALRAPPAWLLVLLILAVFADALSQFIEQLRFLEQYQKILDYDQYQETLDANTMVGLLVLLIIALARSPSRLAVAPVAALVVAVLTILIRSKAYFAISVAATVVLATSILRSPRLVAPMAAITIAGLAGTTILLWFSGGEYLSWLNMRSIENSVLLRLELWDFAWRLALDSFPWGVGLGQYGALIGESTELGSLGLRYVHNTPLALFAEMGVLGLFAVAGLGYLIYLACRPWAWPVALTYLIYLVLPLMLHDVLGMRMTILVLAYGVSESWRVFSRKG